MPQVHRAYKLFTNVQLRRMKISNRDLVTRILILTSFDMLVIVIWYSVAPPYVRTHTEVSGFAAVPYTTCATELPALALVLWVYK
jgi:hypothetical protein